MVKKMDSDCVKTNEGAVQHPTMLTAVFIVVLLSGPVLISPWLSGRSAALWGCLGQSNESFQFGQQPDTLNCTWVTANNLATAVTSGSSTYLVNVIKLNMPHNFLSVTYRVGETSPWPCAEAHRFKQFVKSFVHPELAVAHFI